LRETSNFQKFIALSVSWTIIGGLIFFIVWVSLFASNLNKVDLNGYYATQEEYACLISGGSCESCVIDDILSCSQAINTMHSED